MTFVLGGARSGKSSFALNLAKKEEAKLLTVADIMPQQRTVAFIATCNPYDEEMAERVRKHQQERPAHWRTYQEISLLSPLLQQIKDEGIYQIVIIDCLTLFISNLMLDKMSEREIQEETGIFLDIIKQTTSPSIQAFIISNEVGQGIVPENKLAREFRDVSGRINQLVAGSSDKFFSMIAGIPLQVK
ncbi:MAG: bifunctional adenosylcobinamide kinase/adenosylcobinamide-phosphate guanylyltransferase [Oligoflexia bacterium]|nr:bifunctional adenosylcobinamide kinase/adenosylcobinamide-phosphate guanylyltransferase [Oligoflexia bacterium]